MLDWVFVVFLFYSRAFILILMATFIYQHHHVSSLWANFQIFFLPYTTPIRYHLLYILFLRRLVSQNGILQINGWRGYFACTCVFRAC